MINGESGWHGKIGACICFQSNIGVEPDIIMAKGWGTVPDRCHNCDGGVGQVMKAGTHFSTLA